MKKVLFLVVAFLFFIQGVDATPQVSARRAKVLKGTNSVVYSLPQTVLKVTLITEKESIRTGPYARFAQKYLGVIASLADNDFYTIVDGQLDYFVEADPSEVYVLDNPDRSPAHIYDLTPEGMLAIPLEGHTPSLPTSEMLPLATLWATSYTQSDTSFVKVPFDKRTSVDASPETMAQEAANMIFMLRKRRIELVTGEFGENVFGSGLQAALQEIDHLEQEYTSLFMGKQFRQRIVKEYEIIPQKGSNTAIVCRFSEALGLLPSSNLYGNPITLEFVPENKLVTTPWRPSGRAKRGMIYFRIADMSGCRLVNGNNELTGIRLPVYQFGMTVQMPITALKEEKKK